MDLTAWLARIVLGSLFLLTAGCASLLAPTPTPTATPTATPLPTPSPWPSPTPEPADTGWQRLASGVEWRQVLVPIDGVTERLAILRLDPHHVRFRVHYDPGQPEPVSGWAERLGARVVVNAGYFTPENRTIGLLIGDGQSWGEPYGDFAGLFAVDTNDQVSVRWLRERPYDPAEPLHQAVMSFPLLVKPGGALGFPADADDGTPSRRTVVGQDTQGRILFLVAPRGYLSLHRLAQFLVGSDLAIDAALNLDGGSSTGLWLDLGGERVSIDSRTAIPAVIAIDVR